MVTYTEKEAVKEPEKTSDQNTSKQDGVKTENSIEKTALCQASASTGYESHEIFWFVILGFSALGMMIISVFRKQKKAQ